MYDLPQQPPDGQVIIPIEVGEREIKATHDEMTFEILEKPSLPLTKLEEKDLYALAHYLKAKHSKGFTWTELPHIIDEVVAFIHPNTEMSIKEKRIAALETIHYLLVSIDALYLPEKATESFFEELVPPFLNLAFIFPGEKALIEPHRTAPITERLLSDYSDQLLNHFEEGISWKTLALMTKHALSYILSCKNLSEEEQKEATFKVIEKVLTKASPSHLPPHYDGKLFFPFLKSFITLQLPSKKNTFQ